jgi:hypothetical protein
MKQATSAKGRVCLNRLENGADMAPSKPATAFSLGAWCVDMGGKLLPMSTSAPAPAGLFAFPAGAFFSFVAGHDWLLFSRIEGSLSVETKFNPAEDFGDLKGTRGRGRTRPVTRPCHDIVTLNLFGLS